MAENVGETSQEALPLCFVAMPIKKAGTEDHKHFQAIYDNLADSAGALGFEVLRADKIVGGGNIGRDVINSLAEADVVIADLTDLNPNVFYEVGLRHALRRQGTLLLIDQNRTDTIPFDLSQYRVMQYEGDLAGIRELTSVLTEFLKVFLQGRVTAGILPTDSPLHDWYPELPSDLLAHSRSEVAPAVAQELSDLRRQLEHYREVSNRPDGLTTSAPQQTPRSVIDGLRQAEKAGALLHQFVAAAAESVENRDVAGFLDATERLFRSRQTPDLKTYLRFCTWADLMGLPELAPKVLENAEARLPTDRAEVQGAMIRYLSRSPLSEDRDRARLELASRIGFDLESEELLPDADVDAAASDIGYLVEILHGEMRDALGLKLLEQATDRSKHPDLVRDWARQLQWSNELVRAYEAFVKCLSEPRPEQETLRWFGNFLHNNGFHIEAAELFLLEGFFDLDDANGALHFADELSFFRFDFFALPVPAPLQEAVGNPRDLPGGVDCVEAIHDALNVALSAGTLAPSQIDTLERVIKRAGVDGSRLVGGQDKHERVAWFGRSYRQIASELTSGSSVAERLLRIDDQVA